MSGQRACIWLLVVTLVIVPTVAHAQALDSSLQSMFNNWGAGVTIPPGAYDSQSRGILSGGGLSVRTFNNSFALYSITPPRMSVGCQGIDVYLGSFSYGKLSRYVTLLTQIGTGVVLGYAFQLAMKAICPDCADVLNKIEAAARALNTAGRLQPCQTGIEMGKALAGDEASQTRLTSRYGDAWQKMQESATAITDVWEGRDTTATKTNRDAATAMAGTTYDVRGNLVWYVLQTAGADVETSRMIMSAVGTVVVDEDGDMTFKKPVLDFDTLIDANNGDQVKLYACAPDVTECLHPTEVIETTVQGFHNRVYDGMTTVVDKIYTETAIGPTEQAIINMSPVPIEKMIVEYGRPRPVANQIVTLSSELVAADLAYQWMRWAVEEVQRNIAFMKKLRPEWPGDTGAFGKSAQEKLREARERMTKRTGMLNELYALIQVTKASGDLRPRR